jgi:hypothetical protein
MSWNVHKHTTTERTGTIVMLNDDPDATVTADYQAADAAARALVPVARLNVSGYSVGYNRAMRVYRYLIGVTS